mgnify:CR=1 FL=1
MKIENRSNVTIISNIDNENNFYLFINKEVNCMVQQINDNGYSLIYHPSVNKDIVGAIIAEKFGSDCKLQYIKFNPIEKDNFIIEEFKNVSILNSIMIPNKQIVYNGSYYILHDLT